MNLPEWNDERDRPRLQTFARRLRIDLMNFHNPPGDEPQIFAKYFLQFAKTGWAATEASRDRRIAAFGQILSTVLSEDRYTVEKRTEIFANCLIDFATSLNKDATPRQGLQPVKCKNEPPSRSSNSTENRYSEHNPRTSSSGRPKPDSAHEHEAAATRSDTESEVTDDSSDTVSTSDSDTISDTDSDSISGYTDLDSSSDMDSMGVSLDRERSPQPGTGRFTAKDTALRKERHQGSGDSLGDAFPGCGKDLVPHPATGSVKVRRPCPTTEGKRGRARPTPHPSNDVLFPAARPKYLARLFEDALMMNRALLAAGFKRTISSVELNWKAMRSPVLRKKIGYGQARMFYLFTRFDRLLRKGQTTDPPRGWSLRLRVEWIALVRSLKKLDTELFGQVMDHFERSEELGPSVFYFRRTVRV